MKKLFLIIGIGAATSGWCFLLSWILRHFINDEWVIGELSGGFSTIFSMTMLTTLLSKKKTKNESISLPPEMN